jgi:hypothetical protein
MLNFEILPNGNLSVTATDEGREYISDFAHERDRQVILFDLCEAYSCNGSFTFFGAGEGNPNVGLTDAPCIAECLSYEDDGTAIIEGRFWYLRDYATRDELEDWQNGKAVIFTLAK